MGQKNIALQAAAKIAGWLKPAVENGSCQVKESDSSISFLMTEGSASVAIDVAAHPQVEDDALVTVRGSLAQLPVGFDNAQLLMKLLEMNNTLPGFAVCLQGKDQWLILRGTLLGSTMDQPEFMFLLQALAATADKLDDMLNSLLQSKEGAQEPDSSSKEGGFGKLIQQIVGYLEDRQEELIKGFCEDLSPEEKSQLDELLKDQGFVTAVKDFVLGEPAAIIAAALANQETPDDQVARVIEEVMERVPKHELFRKLLANVAITMAMILAKSAGADPKVVIERMKKISG